MLQPYSPLHLTVFNLFFYSWEFIAGFFLRFLYVLLWDKTTGTVKRYDYSSAVQTKSLIKAMSTGGTFNKVPNIPLEGATVTIIETNQSTSTDTNGNFGFEEVPTGTLTIEIKKDQYIPLRVTADATTSINVLTSYTIE